jgi:large subunit ribosomal protein L17
MKKRVFGRKLSRGKKVREALFRSLTRALIIDKRIVTTKAKAKAIVGFAEKLATLAKDGSLSARRSILASLANDRVATEILCTKIAPSLQSRASGHVTTTLLSPRRGDAAEMMRVEWVVKVEADDKKPDAKAEAKEAKTRKKETKKVEEKVKS